MVLEGCIRGGSTSAIGSAAVEDVRRYGMVGEEWVSVRLGEEDVSLSSEPASSQYAVHSGKCRRDGAEQVSCGEQRSVEDAVGASGWELEAMKCPLLRWETDVEGTGGMFKTCGRAVLGGRGERRVVLMVRKTSPPTDSQKGG